MAKNKLVTIRVDEKVRKWIKQNNLSQADLFNKSLREAKCPYIGPGKK